MELPSVTILRSQVDRVLGRRDGVQIKLGKVEDEIRVLEQEQLLLDLVAALLRRLVDQEVTIGIQAVEKLQTEGLQTVFEDQDLRIRAEVGEKQGKVSVDLLTVQRTGGLEVEGVSNDVFGGAISTVESILLRIIIMFRRGLRPVLFLDEALPAFDSNYISNMGQFLSVLCSRLGMDILAVTHDPMLVEAADRGYRIVKHGNVARFEAV